MSMCDVLGVLEDTEEQVWATFAAAVELAEAENARLTLAKTTDEGRSYMWLSPFAFGGAYVPPSIGADADAECLLARAAELVPVWLPVTTLMLGRDNQGALRKLIRDGRFGAVVAGPHLYGHCPRFASDLRRAGIRTVCTGDPSRSRCGRAIARVRSGWRAPEPWPGNPNPIT